MRHALLALTLALAAAFAMPSAAQNELGERAIKAFKNGDYDEAESLWKRWADTDESTFIPWYNLACARSVRGDTEGAGDYILTAIERGFSNLERLQNDQNLRAFRTTDTYRQLVNAWPSFLDRRIDTQLQAARQTYGPRYDYTKDEKHRLAFASAFDTITSRQAREDIRDVAQWAIRNVFTDLKNDDPNHPDAWALVVLPTKNHFMLWARETYGDIPQSATSQLGGAYSHDDKQLVSIDLGSTLRHEFFHVLHWRSTDRLGQQHPIWIQEGLAALVEDMDQTKRGRYEPALSWRTNTVKRLATQNKLPPIAEFSSMPRERFSARRPLANYAVARGIFMYLHERGLLDDFYKTYTAGFDSDPTGLEAITAVTKMTTDQFDEAMRVWGRDLGEVYEQNRPPSLGIGVQLDLDQGDGPVVRRILHDNATRAGLRPGDVITGLNRRPVRDLNEFYRVLTPLEAGERVEITYRRRTQHKSGTIQLVSQR